jgi:RNA-directed DNA polymerase
VSSHDIAHRILVDVRAGAASREAMVAQLVQPFDFATKTPVWMSPAQGRLAVAQSAVALADDILFFDLLTSQRPRAALEAALRALASFEDYLFFGTAFGVFSVPRPTAEDRRAEVAKTLPRLDSLPDLARFAGLDLAQLDWFAGLPPYRPQGSLGSLVHYRYHWRERPKGPPRLIEAPKSRLKDIQTRILREILDHVPVHAAAHGFVKGRSVISSAGPHAGEAMVIAADLADFFPSVSGGRVYGVFRWLGYSSPVATHLAGLCTTATPRDVFHELAFAERPGFAVQTLFTSAHLPQGAPTSPALANLAAFRLDTRLTGLARRFRLRYTRYADDMAFSGDTLGLGGREAFHGALKRIVENEGFQLHPDKTRHMGASARQRLLGMTINSHLNLPRAEFDRLKAILHLSIRHGPHSQNRDGHVDFRAHLAGRVQWAEHVNPRRGVTLRRLLDRIVWPD